jgi:hypothetical protein
MSPEQMMASGDVDARTDLWSLGVLLYELLTGRLPFVGKNIAAQAALVLEGKPVPPSACSRMPLPAGLDEVILRFMRRNLEERYADAAEAAAALAPFGTAESSRRVDRIARSLRRRAPASSGPDISLDKTTPMAADASAARAAIAAAEKMAAEKTFDTAPTVVRASSPGLPGAPILNETARSPGMGGSTRATWQTSASPLGSSSKKKLLAALALLVGGSVAVALIVFAAGEDPPPAPASDRAEAPGPTATSPAEPPPRGHRRRGSGHRRRVHGSAGRTGRSHRHGGRRAAGAAAAGAAEARSAPEEGSAARGRRPVRQGPTLSTSMRVARTIPTIAALIAAALCTDARAQDESSEAAQRLFEEGMKLMEEGNYDEACPRLEESQRIDAGMATQFRLAQCYEKAGRVASAWRNYQAVAVSARAEGQKDREAYAQERADALIKQVARLTVQVPPDVASLPGLTVSVDGTAIGAADWGGVPVDRGRHDVVASALGKRAWKTTVEVAENGARLTTRVPALQDAVNETLDVAPAPPPKEDGDGGLGPVSIAGIVLTAVGAAGIGAGIGLGVAAKGKHGDADAYCQEQFCTPEGIAIRDDARALGNIATGVFVAGAAVGVAGVLMWILGPPADDGDAASIRVAPTVGGVVVSSRW